MTSRAFCFSKNKMGTSTTEKCTQIATKDKRCKNDATKGDLCTLHHNQKVGKNETKTIINNNAVAKEQCIQITTRNKRCKSDATKGELCTRHYNQKMGKNKTKTDEQLEGKCTQITTRKKRCKHNDTKDELYTRHY